MALTETHMNMVSNAPSKKRCRAPEFRRLSHNFFPDYNQHISNTMNHFQRQWKTGELMPGQTEYVRRLHAPKIDHLENVTLRPDGFDHLPERLLSHNAYTSTATRFYAKKGSPATRIHLNVKDDPVLSPRKRRWASGQPQITPATTLRSAVWRSLARGSGPRRRST